MPNRSPRSDALPLSQPNMFTLRKPKGARVKLLLLMLLAYGLRLALISNGGQMAHADEHRYFRAVQAAEHLFAGDFAAAADRLLRYGHHHAIPTVELPMALFHRLIYGVNHSDSLQWGGLLKIPGQMFWLPALLFALPSVFMHRHDLSDLAARRRGRIHRAAWRLPAAFVQRHVYLRPAPRAV